MSKRFALAKGATIDEKSPWHLDCFIPLRESTIEDEPINQGKLGFVGSRLGRRRSDGSFGQAYGGHSAFPSGRLR